MGKGLGKFHNMPMPSTDSTDTRDLASVLSVPTVPIFQNNKNPILCFSEKASLMKFERSCQKMKREPSLFYPLKAISVGFIWLSPNNFIPHLKERIKRKLLLKDP